MSNTTNSNKHDEIRIHSEQSSTSQVLSSTTKLHNDQSSILKHKDSEKKVTFKLSEKPIETDTSLPIPTSTSTKRLAAHSAFVHPNSTSNTIHNQSNLNASNDINLSNLSTKHSDIRSNKAYCLVWTPIPLISLFLPFYGHTGITSSTGSIYDFGSSRYVSINQLTYGAPYKYIPLCPNENEKKIWDFHLIKMAKRYARKEYTLCGKNGYKFCSSVLNKIQLHNKNNYNQKDIMNMSSGCKYYVSSCAFVKTYLGIVVLILCLVIILINVILL